MFNEYFVLDFISYISITFQIAVDATWAITYLSDAANDLTDKLLATEGLLEMLVLQLNQKETNVITPTLRAVGNIVVGTDEQTDKVIQAGVLGVSRFVSLESKLWRWINVLIYFYEGCPISTENF